jgi:hypothetical protein
MANEPRPYDLESHNVWYADTAVAKE